MADIPSPRKIILPAICFDPLKLGAVDHLPVDIELVLAWNHCIDPVALESAFLSALRRFPHLTGRLAVDEKNPYWSIEPSATGVPMEVLGSGESLATLDLKQMTLMEHRTKFMPATAQNSPHKHLLKMRLTLFPGPMSILGIKVSHAAVDGTGLALFLNHCAAALRKRQPLEVFHERHHIRGNTPQESDPLPHRYRKTDHCLPDPDPLARIPSIIFELDIEATHCSFNAGTMLDARLRLAAWLCIEAASMHPPFSEVAVWCDPRGLNGIPPTYTGNSGCYLHFPLRNIGELTSGLRSLATRSGFHLIAETHRRIQQTKAAGNTIVWYGPGKDILQLNLVPHAAESANFGAGPPVFGLMLSRNSSGLRISVTPDATRFLIEACLPNTLATDLVDACLKAGLNPRIWCQGSDRNEKPC